MRKLLERLGLLLPEPPSHSVEEATVLENAKPITSAILGVGPRDAPVSRAER